MKLKKLILLLLFVAIWQPGRAMEIKGRIILENDWKPFVFLASLNSPENLFVASPDFVISNSIIQPDGTFSITTVDVPEEPRFYRLYLVKGDLASVEFSSSKNKNYIHLLLDRNSKIEINASIVNNTFHLNELRGDEDTRSILSFDAEFEKRKEQFTPDITKAKSDFLTKGLEDFIQNFVDSTSNGLVGLYALYHIDDKETSFLRNSDFYFDFQKRLNSEYSGTLYAQEYSNLLSDLVGFRDMVCEIPGVGPKWKDRLLIAESIAIFLLLFIIIYFMLKLKKAKSINALSDNSKLAFQNLTGKEQEILKLLASGKSNKEIAAHLFVELSTVKTHINSIYKQLNLSSRGEAIRFYNSI